MMGGPPMGSPMGGPMGGMPRVRSSFYGTRHACYLNAELFLGEHCL